WKNFNKKQHELQARAGGGVSMGNYVNVSIKDGIQGDFKNRVINDPLFMHEYGHTFDSQIYGLSYLFAIGIPSSEGAKWTEVRANRHAARYFGKHYGVDWTPFLSKSVDGGYPLKK